MEEKTVNSAQMHQVDSLAVSEYGIPSIVLMENAARSVYERITKEINLQDQILIVCGAGNNGGDGFAIARLLHISGYLVSIFFAGKEEKLTNDARTNYLICQKLGIPFIQEVQGDIIIDCLFGTGLSREITGNYKEIIEQINRLEKPVFSIDMPSGLSSDEDKILGVCVNAKKTYTFQLGKTGLYGECGKKVAGEIEILDIFIPRELLKD